MGPRVSVAGLTKDLFYSDWSWLITISNRLQAAFAFPSYISSELVWGQIPRAAVRPRILICERPLLYGGRLKVAKDAPRVMS